MAFVSVESLLRAAGDMPLWEAVLTDDLRDRGGERDASWEKMTRLWRAMVESVEGYDPARRSACCPRCCCPSGKNTTSPRRRW